MARGERLLRQWELLKTLQAHRFGVTAGELAERLGCAKRTVQRDLAVLRLVFPVEYEQRDLGRRYWKLTGGFLESQKLQLSLTEMLSLHLAQKLLAPLAGTPMGDGLATALHKIRAVLPAGALSHFRELDETFFIKSIGREDYSSRGAEVALLNEAVLHRRVVRVTYHSASRGRLLDTELHPYGMILLGASLYCVGYLAEYGEVRTLKVSRIKRVAATGRSFDRPAAFSLARHTQGAFGVFGPGRVRTVRVRFTGWAATNVREHRWHASQRIIADDGERLTAQFELASTVEFKRWLLGFGRCAVVLRPSDFAREIADELAAAAGNYGR
ncbi:MAG: WYL domain-containing protein [Planctomycetes bacterium]|nr:WYL domain-containing protein [Planctomycetota bacterium]